MESFIIGLLLIITGFTIATSGYPMFRIMLPIMGFIAGFGLGFSMVQAVTGANAFAFIAALLTALMTGLIFAALSYFYYVLGILLVAASLFSGVFAYLGQVVGLRQDGFVVGLLALTGGVIGVITVLKYGLQHDFIVVLTSMFGVGTLFVGAFLIFGDFTLADLHKDGITQSISKVVSSSWVWIIAWLAGTIIAVQSQIILIARAVFGEQFVIEATKKK